MLRIIPFFQSETQLVKALQQNESRAQKAVYERYAGKMMAVCTRYIANRSDAEEVMIDGFMRAYERIGQFREEGSFEGWLRRIMVTESLMYLRRTKVWRQAISLDEVSEEPDYEWADQALETDDLLRLVGQLPEGYRTIFNLYAIEGYSHQEIAQELSISEGTSKSQLSRARAWLQASLAKLEKENYGQIKSKSTIG
ncbi:sigma-70 family RNA polymerase sigma factor [Rudanella paleaurantiibacter]|uniref:Sigma-70 family RNA polymerase sigma factor n=1 Tax=Rudanella paleaurantiibacter TaxID=2614655 RepID=A0A7J5U1S9_9BACT|nr:sigma-70 family RNA polymerase sigma factor [Rudanella paleaurantiibacter]KAB7731660.1 sigma-70 family RNA polymerase sigma factor [Rudanella paleaurantiibacter]